MSKKTKKPKKATFVSFLLDETGSMQSIKDDTVGGFNAYVETLQKGGADIIFSLVSFNSSVTQKRYVAEPIGKIEPLTDANYQPRAMTPLIDASVKIINATAEAVQQRHDDPNVVIVMQTDGQENVSVEYTTTDLAALIKEKEAAGWQFVFLGAGLDAFAAAREAGPGVARPPPVVRRRQQRSEVHQKDRVTVAPMGGDLLEGAVGDLGIRRRRLEKNPDVGVRGRLSRGRRLDREQG